MKRKGFTLAELLGVIVIMSLLLLLVIPTIINGVKNKEEDVAQVQNNIIFEAVGEYLDLDKDKYPNTPGNVYCITTGELIEAGKLVDPVKKIVEEGNYGDDYTIEAKISSTGIRKYTATTQDECKNYTSKNIEMVVSPSNNKWSTSKTATIYYPDLGDGYTMEYKIDDGDWQTTNSKDIELTFNKDSKVEARMTGKSEINKKGTVEKIDTVPPVVISTNLGSWNNNLEQQINITVTDAHSGVGGYCIKSSMAKPSANDSCFKTVKFPAYGGVGTISEFLPEGTYYIFIKDRAGNVSETDDSNSFKIEDNNPPTCSIHVQSCNTSTGKCQIEIIASDSDSGIEDYGFSSSFTPKSQTISANGTFTAHVVDRAGNTNTCTNYLQIIPSSYTEKSCPSGYTLNSSGTTCSKQVTTSKSASYSSGYYYCSNSTYTLKYFGSNFNSGCDSDVPVGYHCVHKLEIVGTIRCKDGSYLSNTNHGSYACLMGQYVDADTYYEDGTCDNPSTYCSTKAGNDLHPSEYDHFHAYEVSYEAADTYLKYSSGYYYCPSGYTSSGSGSSMKCYKTTTTTSTPTTVTYYYCPSGYTSVGSGSSMRCIN